MLIKVKHAIAMIFDFFIMKDFYFYLMVIVLAYVLVLGGKHTDLLQV